jgi:ZIP family zinc transporter
VRDTARVLEAAFWGLVGGLALVVGAILALNPRHPIPPRAIGFVMAFGAGVLISAVSFDLTEEAIAIGGGGAAAAGLGAGALAYFGGDRLIGRGKPKGDDDDPRGIVLGALLDGIPESAAIGLTLLAGGGVSVSFIAAVFISNLPESIAASSELKAQHSARWILLLWTAIAVASAIAAGLGYELLGGASDNAVAFVKAFAGGAILCMLADTMVPQALKKSGDRVGLVTVLGFALAALLSTA